VEASFGSGTAGEAKTRMTRWRRTSGGGRDGCLPACLLRAKCFRLLSPLFAAGIVVRGAVDSL